MQIYYNLKGFLLNLVKTTIMKNLILLFVGLFLLTSCEITERVYIDENGEVSYATNIDLTQLMQMMPADNLSNDLPMDTIFTADGLSKADHDLTQGLGDSLEDEEEKELMKDFKFHVKLDKTEGFMTVFLEKKSLKDFNSYMKEFDKNLTQLNRKRAEENKKLPDSLQKSDIDVPIYSTPQFTYDGKTFKRKGKFRDSMKKSEKDVESDIEGLEGLENLILYKLEYHFPKPIKSVSDKTIKLSADRKTIYLDKPMKTVMENPEAYDFEVTF